MAFLNPTVNAYRRIDPHELVPTRACWGYDNRFGLVRVPPERGGATRVEMRLADGAANPYLATAALLFAGLDGIRRELTPPAAVAGLVYELPEEEQGDPIPLSLDAALEALEADATLREAMGARSSTRSSRSSATSSSAITATSRTGTSRSTRTTSSSRVSTPCASASAARTVATSASVEKPSACAASVAACTSAIVDRPVSRA